ncbi:MAG: hypothetical protein ACI30R_01325 [Sodaliphilus sp.]
MGRIHRYRTAWSRHHRSGGFGIHSPFAFRFVQQVLGERCPYYAYADIKRFRTRALEMVPWRRRRSAVVEMSTAKMLFRIANFYNPLHLLVVGSRYGVEAASVMAVSSRSEGYLLGISSEAVDQLRAAFSASSVKPFSDFADGLAHYFAALAEGELPFVLIHEISDETAYFALKSAILPWMEKEGVLILCHLHDNPLMLRLWNDCIAAGSYGQTYTNEKIGIFIINPKLQYEHFSLWL